jgi:hypothetical protein
MGASQSSSDDKEKNQNSLFPNSAPAPSAPAAVVGGKGKSAMRSARRSKSARKGARRSSKRSAKRSSKRGMKGGSSCMKMSGGKHRRSRSRSRGRGRR